jgi:small-conductance mechanosensitive channel/CRP-like cAMP-binding protein
MVAMIFTVAALAPNTATFLVGIGDMLLLPDNLNVRRELLAAVIGLLLVLILLPQGRRRLAMWPLTLLVCTPLPFLITLLFPESSSGPASVLLGARFFLVASLLQSALLLIAVAAWERVRPPLSRIFLDVLRWLTVAAAFVAMLSAAGVEAESLFTGSAVITAVLGFALKETLGNVFAGLAIQAERPFEPGDWIQYDSNPAHVGRVIEINWRATKVITLDEVEVIIPNAQLALASIRNFTKPEPWSRRSIYVVTPYGVPPQRVQAIILQAVRGGFGVREHPTPTVVTNAFTDRGVEHWVRIYTAEFDKRDRVDGMARDRIWYALTRHGIDMPVATHAVRMTPLPPPEPESSDVAVARRMSALEHVGVLDILGKDLLQTLAAESQERTYATGEQVIRQGEPGESMFVILSGHVEVTTREGNGPVVQLAELTAGDYFGEMSLMTGAPRMATVTAREETRVVEVGHVMFGHVLENRPELVEELGKVLHDRLAERAEAVAAAAGPPPETQDLLRKIREFFSL